MTILGNGNVGIGTSNPGAKLEVKGKIKAQEVLIALDSWKDCVFKSDYPLLPLVSLEQYISENNHLPEVPSENEIVEKGLAAGEMAKIQMQKIEELTLYIIDLNKRMEKLEKENTELKNNTK